MNGNIKSKLNLNYRKRKAIVVRTLLEYRRRRRAMYKRRTTRNDYRSGTNLKLSKMHLELELDAYLQSYSSFRFLTLFFGFLLHFSTARTARTLKGLLIRHTKGEVLAGLTA